MNVNVFEVGSVRLRLEREDLDVCCQHSSEVEGDHSSIGLLRVIDFDMLKGDDLVNDSLSDVEGAEFYVVPRQIDLLVEKLIHNEKEKLVDDCLVRDGGASPRKRRDRFA